MASSCYLCNSASESLDHLFINCSYAQCSWRLLKNKANFNLQIMTVKDWFSHYRIDKSYKVALVFKVAVVFLFNQIWMVRYDIKYNNRKISSIDSINMINMHVKISGKNTSNKISFPSMTFLPSRLLVLIFTLLYLLTSRRFLGVLPSRDGKNAIVTDHLMILRILLALVESLETTWGILFLASRRQLSQTLLFMLKL